MKNHTKLLSAAAVSAALIVSCALPTEAAERESAVVHALHAVSAKATDSTTNVLNGVAMVTMDVEGSTAIDSTVNGVNVSVPVDPAKPLSLHAPGKAISVTLPFANSASKARVVAHGVVSYNKGNGTTTVPVVKEDGSVQVTTVISGDTAPTRYDYTLGLIGGDRIEQLENGSIAVYDRANGLAAGIAPAWAKDANGTELPTRYEVNGDVVTQVIEHDASTV
ncbi:hypothetical protein [Rathayibacter toxicus]|uniref:hypothetical protein n=1 Tax=Rathayibacter toxicus TaxID=145458 RepID=UPI001C05952F|nr:hypothetical protein [Rathayibacter toxicus]QWL30909.1 hypothetical protein E2R34_09255 [Rathayibacter toxicus]